MISIWIYVKLNEGYWQFILWFPFLEQIIIFENNKKPDLESISNSRWCPFEKYFLQSFLKTSLVKCSSVEVILFYDFRRLTCFKIFSLISFQKHFPSIVHEKLVSRNSFYLYYSHFLAFIEMILNFRLEIAIFLVFSSKFHFYYRFFDIVFFSNLSG